MAPRRKVKKVQTKKYRIEELERFDTLEEISKFFLSEHNNLKPHNKIEITESYEFTDPYSAEPDVFLLVETFHRETDEEYKKRIKRNE